MSFYNYKEIEFKWQGYWVEYYIFKIGIDVLKFKFYVFDMFLYLFGVGLYVGYLEGYIVIDIFSCYKRV